MQPLCVVKADSWHILPLNIGQQIKRVIFLNVKIDGAFRRKEHEQKAEAVFGGAQDEGRA